MHVVLWSVESNLTSHIQDSVDQIGEELTMSDAKYGKFAERLMAKQGWSQGEMNWLNTIAEILCIVSSSKKKKNRTP